MGANTSIVRVCVSLLIAFAVSLAHADDLPDLIKTPGKFRPGLTTKVICKIQWGKDERHVIAAMKREVFARYGYTGRRRSLGGRHPRQDLRNRPPH